MLEFQRALVKRKIKPSYNSNVAETPEFLWIIFTNWGLVLKSIRKGYYLTGKQGVKVSDAAFTGADGEHLAGFPGKSPELFQCNVTR